MRLSICPLVLALEPGKLVQVRRRLPTERQGIVAGPPDGEGPYGWRYWRKWISEAPRL